MTAPPHSRHPPKPPAITLVPSVPAGQRLRHPSTSSSLSSLASSSRPAVHLLNKDVSRLHSHRHRSIRRDNRVLLTTLRNAPFVVYSCVPYSKHSKFTFRGDGRRHGSGSSHENLLLFGSVEDGQDVSYGQFLAPSSSKAKSARTDNLLVPISESAHASPAKSPSEVPLFRSFSHDPSLLQRYHSQQATLLPTVLESEVESISKHHQLDDPELRSGKHRTLLTFPSYMTSVIDYVKPSDLKKELNEKFREKFPHIQLTLSKLRSLKQAMKKIAHIRCGVDLWTIATAHVYFERIIMKGLINKANRRLCAGASLMLAAKLNDVKGNDLSKLIDEIEDTFKLHRRELLACELGILVALEFSLLVSDLEVKPHHQRLVYTS
ncbi:hypothetical protein CAPTEDRAFT_221978 [Capitella teleta]|uniref:Cyclin N-terminal domain-containing protein n=1 Tax=Capitella teleta TaxID=283909 RepID=R7UII1_CAPTE|nr:hypothetical protein CAPTEDRAFT_221978 [Capitella teleta]|eukprot:ELU05908.1 hypothetical protein CAPTEDRAFT_221978 [Capitella teleta]